MMTKELYTTTEAAKYLGVTPATIRNWDKSGKLTPSKTTGGHRRYCEGQLCRIIQERKNGYNYSTLYSNLCKSVEILDFYKDENLPALIGIRDNIGQKLLSQLKENTKWENN